MRNALNTKGFTIVELLIATSIFTLVLVFTIIAIFDFSHRYYKSVNSSVTQESARTVLGDVTQAIEFSGSQVLAAPVPVGNINAWCVGTVQFNYRLFSPESSTNDTLWESPDTNAGTCSPELPNTPGSSELLGANLQVIRFIITPLTQPNLYNVDLIIGYSPNSPSLICDTAKHANCPTSDSNTGLGIADTDDSDSSFKCVINEGTQFCGVFNLNSDIQVRGTGS